MQNSLTLNLAWILLLTETKNLKDKVLSDSNLRLLNLELEME